MKDSDGLVVSVSCSKDIDLITNNTKYINLNITNPDVDIINFFKKNGENYLYSEIIDGCMGYIYVNYDEFVKAESIIDGICAEMPDSLNKIEIARYLYTCIPKYVHFDINLNYEKNENCNLVLINNVNNLWGSLALGRVNDKSIAKIYYYLCRRFDIDVNIITSFDADSYVKLRINKMDIIADLFNDLPFVQAKMKTYHFGTYNDDVDLDKKVFYIKNKYNDDVINKCLKEIDYTCSSCVEKILVETEKILNVSFIRPVELSIIYEFIFKKYCPNYNVKVNNLFLNCKEKNHFIVFNCDDDYYSYNYKKNNFVKVNDVDIIKNINMGKIGIYLDEFIPTCR